MNKLDEKEQQSVLDNYLTILKFFDEAGCRLTSQRRIIVDFLLDHSGQYLDCETIYDWVKTVYPAIGIATIYRTLSLLEKFNLVSAISPNGEGRRYRLQIEQSKNCLLICRKCGSVKEYLPSTEWVHRIQEKNGFVVEEVSIYGVCKNCKP